MDFKEAYETIVKRSVERNTKEIPTILSCLDFEKLECLDANPKSGARLAIKLAGFIKNVTCLEKNEDIIKSIKEAVKQNKVEKKISIKKYRGYKEEKFPFQDKSFDVVYYAWGSHETLTDPKFLDELARVSRKYVLLIMAGIEGDEPTLISLVRDNEKKRRTEIRKKVSDYLQNKGFKIKFKEEILRLEFKDEQEIYDVFKCLAFKNEDLGDKDDKVRKFLSSKVKNFQDGFYCLIAEK